MVVVVADMVDLFTELATNIVRTGAVVPDGAPEAEWVTLEYRWAYELVPV